MKCEAPPVNQRRFGKVLHCRNKARWWVVVDKGYEWAWCSMHLRVYKGIVQEYRPVEKDA